MVLAESQVQADWEAEVGAELENIQESIQSDESYECFVALEEEGYYDFWEQEDGEDYDYVLDLVLFLHLELLLLGHHLKQVAIPLYGVAPDPVVELDGERHDAPLECLEDEQDLSE